MEPVESETAPTKANYKRHHGPMEAGDEWLVRAEGRAEEPEVAGGRVPKKARGETSVPASPAASDSDYTDFEDELDEFNVPGDMEDYLDDVELEDDQQSTASTKTTMSTGSVGSNTPSLVGENLENFSLGEGGPEAQGLKPIGGGPLVRNAAPPLRRSLFSHVPPSLNFVHHNEVPATPLPAELRKNLRWKLSTITPAVVKRVVTNTGFRLMRKSCSEWGGTWGKHMKSPMFQDLGHSQKINHFPGTFHIGRKDRLWKNYHKLRTRFGPAEFSFLPRTFCLPADTKILRRVWEKRGIKAKWIVKPPAMARGTGIKVVNKWNQIPKTRPLVVQRYIARPHLINNTKYDLRIYVLMTSLNPLRIYLYDEGLVRFASNKYNTDSNSLADVYMHLTNYSINKNSSTYVPNEDSEMRQGHKWTLGSLWQYFSELGIDQKPVWDRIKDMVVKTIISAEHSMFPLNRANLASHYCGYELFGFDVLLDADLKPWLIEVNISPSLHSSSPLDLDVKSPLATEVFNIARYHVPNRISAKSQRAILQKLNLEDLSTLCLEPKLYTRDLSKADKAKQTRMLALAESRDTYLDSILEKLTPDDVRYLIRAEDELTQLTHFSRIFPTQETHKYFKYFQIPRYHNMLFDAWENKYGDCRVAGIDRLEELCLERVHLKVPSGANNKQIDVSVLKGPTSEVVRQSPSLIGQEPSPGAAKSKRASVVAKPLNVKPNFCPISLGRSKTTTALNKATSPEPMSMGSGDSEDKSRSPSPRESRGRSCPTQLPSSSSASWLPPTTAPIANEAFITTGDPASGNLDNELPAQTDLDNNPVSSN
eukprot:maker-scaffold10_size831480-snap-gene-0.19 protein:Tk01801 transcript:maker-scaffold10_size831480-snap-gene-0.19-mRNA-1 annotation:"tubulin polyglutamylase ttll4"